MLTDIEIIGLYLTRNEFDSDYPDVYPGMRFDGITYQLPRKEQKDDGRWIVGDIYISGVESNCPHVNVADADSLVRLRFPLDSVIIRYGIR